MTKKMTEDRKMNYRFLKNYEEKILLENLIMDEVYCSYNGAVGCMCGCKGNYSYTEASREYSSKDRGYEVTDDEIKERSVRMAINKLKKSENTCWDEKAYCFYLEENGRNTVVYLVQ